MWRLVRTFLSGVGHLSNAWTLATWLGWGVALHAAALGAIAGAAAVLGLSASGAESATFLLIVGALFGLLVAAVYFIFQMGRVLGHVSPEIAGAANQIDRDYQAVSVDHNP